jgi:Lrp/AsnC family transcriptional regulator for asnA, asnC and gidA
MINLGAMEADKNQLDYTDRSILKLLIKDARMPFSEISKKLKVSNSLVHQRIGRLKKLEVITGSGLHIDPKKMGYNSCAYTGIVLSEARLSEKVAAKIERIEEVVECHYVSGKYALFVKVYAFDNDHMRKVLYEKLHSIEGVSSTDTFMSFKTYFDREVGV